MTSSPSVRQRRGDELIAGRFRLGRMIGGGGMGDVWSAIDVGKNERVALKVLRAERHDEEHSAERFRHEATLGKTLVHPNVTRVHELLELDDGTLVLVMELLVGESLRAFLRSRGSLSSAEAVALMLPVLAALQHAHDRGVIHRDLKPANIFLHVEANGDMVPKLLDFGIAKSVDSSVLTQTGDALGTPSYMSPEQVRALPLDGRSDLFAVGVVLYEAIAAQNPFLVSSPSAVLARILELEVDPDPKIDPRVWLEISRALSKQPYERHASATDLAQRLLDAVGEDPAALARFLRRDPPAAEVEIVPPPVLETAPTRSGVRTVDDAPTERMSAPRPTRWLAPLLGLGLVGALLIAAALHARSNETPATTPSASEPAAVVPTHVEETSSSANIAVKPSPSEEVVAPHPRPNRRPKPRPAPDPRSLGRNPGF